jgi:hypothetical protein
LVNQIGGERAVFAENESGHDVAPFEHMPNCKFLRRDVKVITLGPPGHRIDLSDVVSNHVVLALGKPQIGQVLS